MKFKEMAALLKTGRLSAGLTQRDFALQLDSLTQLISNRERAICSLPTKDFRRVSLMLNIPIQKMVDAKVSDFRRRVLVAAFDK